jgi:hypothetical protein
VVVTWCRDLATGVWRWIDKRLERSRIRFVCIVFLLLGLVLLGISFATSDRSRTIFGPPLGADFAGFYTAGAILNDSEPDNRSRLYDTARQDQLYHELLPNIADDVKLPYVHPPFVAWWLHFLARLPYEWAFVTWLLISLGLYLGGLGCVHRSLSTDSRLDWTTVVLLALSFEPFLMECWLGGQLSAIGFFCLALTFALERRRQHVGAGLVLGFCLYKPTLLVLLLPLLVLGRHWRALAGFTLTGMAVAGVSYFGTGKKNCIDYAQTLLGFSRIATGDDTAAGALELRLWKYVDLNSFFRLLLGGHSLLSSLLIGVVAVVPLAVLARAWWQFDRTDRNRRDLLWAATFTFTLVLNLYVGIYDTIVSVLAAVLTAAFFSTRGVWRVESEGWSGAAGPAVSCPSATLRFLLLMLFLVPWVTQPLARATGVQIYTVLLLGIGAFQLLSWGATREPWTVR